jgi:hypothetical protein
VVKTEKKYGQKKVCGIFSMPRTTQTQTSSVERREKILGVRSFGLSVRNGGRKFLASERNGLFSLRKRPETAQRMF